MDLIAQTLENDAVRMEPAEPAHLQALVSAADDGDIWTYMPFGGTREQFELYFGWLLGELEAGRWIPHVVFDKQGGAEACVGMSCYLNIAPRDHRVEIGGTWYNPSVHGTKVNPSCKKLLLAHAFACGAERVEFKTDARNARSRAALRKLGAVEEGILRHHMLLPDGSYRDSAYFSILRGEWESVESSLSKRINS